MIEKDPSVPAFAANMKWGSHACHLYKSREDLLEVLVPYFKQGLESGESCMWVTADSVSPEDARDALAAAVPDFQRYEAAGQIEIISYRDWYVSPGGMMKDLKEVLKGWLGRLERARTLGFEGLRITGNVFFIKMAEEWNDFIAYENQVNSAIGNYRIKAICSYSLDKAKDAHELAEVINSHQCTLVKKNGRWKWIHSAEHKLLEASKVQKEKLSILTRDLERSNSDLAQFAYIASHDLQEPLRTITYFSELLQDHLKAELDVESRHYLESIAGSSMRARKQVEVLLEYSRLEKSEKNLGVVQCQDVVHKAMANLTQSIVETKAKIFCDSLPPVLGEEYLLTQLFQNLISNAIKFRKAETVPVINIFAERNGDKWMIGVRDNGIGIGKEYHERIFQLFQRLHSSIDYPGMGIGLSLCKKIVERHGGRMWVDSRPGNGAVFYFTLSPIYDTFNEFFRKESALLMKQSSEWRLALKDPSENQHLVHFAKNLNALCESVEAFVSGGLESNEAVIIIAAPAHADAFRSFLISKGVPLELHERKGRIRFVDAEEALASFECSDGFIWEAFRSMANEILGRALAGGFSKARVYGEIVNILWARGDKEKAVLLESYWNKFAKEREFVLFCGYIVDNFDAAKDSTALLNVCSGHHKMICPES